MPKRDDLLDRMRRTPSGWSPDHLRRLFVSVGFEATEGSEHTVYRHPDFPQYTSAIPRHRNVKNVYVTKAVKIVERILQEKRRKDAEENTPNDP
jgi:hypothetical protein